MLEQHEALDHLRLASQIAGLEVDQLTLPEERHLVVAGVRLHYLDWGASGRPPLVFLHGGGLTAHTWDVVCLALSGEFHCIAVDLRGHGDSEWSPTLDYAVDAHVRDIAGVVDQLELERPVLVGHSLGGVAAMTYAAQDAERVGGVVMVDVGPKVHPRGAERVRAFLTDTPDRGTLDEFVQRARAFNPRRNPRLLRYSLRHNLRPLPDGRWMWKYDRRGFSRRHFEAVKDSLAALGDMARAITCPVLVVRGADSEALSDADAAAFAGTLPHGRWVTVDGAGHTVQGDNAAGLVEVLRDFLAETGSR